MLTHQTLSRVNMFVLENITLHHLIHNPLNLSHMQIAAMLDKFFVIRQWIETEYIEHHDHYHKCSEGANQLFNCRRVSAHSCVVAHE